MTQLTRAAIRNLASICFVAVACAACSFQWNWKESPVASQESIQRKYIVFYFPALQRKVFVTGSGVDEIEFMRGAGPQVDAVDGRNSKTITMVGEVKLRVRGVLLEANDSELLLNGISMNDHLAAVITASGELRLDAYLREDFD